MVETVIAERKLLFAKHFIESAAESYCVRFGKDYSDLTRFDVECIIEFLALRGERMSKLKKFFKLFLLYALKVVITFQFVKVGEEVKNIE